MENKKILKPRVNRKNNSEGRNRWMIVVNGNMYGTDNPDKRVTRHRNRATKFNEWIEAKWRSECIEYENSDKDWKVQVIKCR